MKLIYASQIVWLAASISTPPGLVKLSMSCAIDVPANHWVNGYLGQTEIHFLEVINFYPSTVVFKDNAIKCIIF